MVRSGHGDVRLVIDDEQRVGIVDDVFVDRDPIEILLQNGAQIAIFVAQPLLLAFNGHHIEQHLVVPTARRGA